MVREAFEQRYLLLRKGPDLLTIDANTARQFVALKHRHNHETTGASKFVNRFAGRFCKDVGDMHDRSSIGEPIEQRRLLASAARVPLQIGGPFRGSVVKRDTTKHFAVIQRQIAKFCLAYLCGIGEDGVENRLQLSLRRADDLQYF